jgi:hypothetical protein
MHKLKMALFSTLALGGAAVLSPASAMPAAALGAATSQAGTSAQEVRWVCGPYRCFWRPGPVVVGPRFYGPGYGFYGPRPYRGYGYGYGRPWRRW